MGLQRNARAAVNPVSSDGSIRALGRCLDVSQSAKANGSKVQLWDCNGTGAQRWWPKSGETTLVNSPSGRCLDMPGANPANGIQLQIYDCNASAAQAWRLP
ncbi:RICIN domain-containing protein [Streptosporangium sp. NBC_01756]|uniref:RICIN domain-containing protein n=1 Tax=Streptosporangium sp. NBC_01756 TaxID=2975950 RepID=UPI002DDB2F3D|nr:RICIN domain-containing protein [Streptosporangium sp. NBC_01756]WSC86761.1 ricin-type beta-trefoil lectin domain protein [Streptosporangium sp. NBC_01756]